MKKQEIESKTEAKSTGSDIGTSGNKHLDKITWPLSEAAAKEIADSDFLLDNETAVGDRGPEVVGEIRLLLFADETVSVTFPQLGRWTPGRIEKAMSRLFRECITERAKAYRESVGLPRDFVGGSGEQL